MTKPNIIFILLDDFGWRDLACFGSEFYETPHMDQLAARGMVFCDAYAAAPVCSPSRASFLTGRYPARVGVTDWIDHGYHIHPARGRLVDAPYLHKLPLEEYNLARALKAQGYAAWHIGKWHLGAEEYGPLAQGFDINIGGGHQGHPWQGYFSPWNLPGLDDGPEGEYLTDRLTDEAIRLIEGHSDGPFFLNFWHYAVHNPIQAKPDDVARFAAKAKDMGLDQLDPFELGEHFPTEHKRHLRIQRRIVQSNPDYAAMIYNLDWNIGRLLQVLEDQGLAEDTLVVFTSDNGGLSSSEGSPTCNAPLCEGKGWMYEGGNRVPLFFTWPGVIEPGTDCRSPFSSPDLYPTLLELAGLPLLPDQHCDGTSFSQVLHGEISGIDNTVFWHYPHYGNQGGTPSGAVRRGDLKLIEFFEDGRVELYNLTEDIGEHRNLAQERAEDTRILHQMLLDWRHSVAGRMPETNPEWHEISN